MTEPTRLLLDVNAPEEAAALLRSLSAPTPPSPAKEAALAQQLASLANTPAAVATVGTALWLKAAAVVLALGVVAVWVSVRLSAQEPARALVPVASASAVLSALPALVGSAPALPEPAPAESAHTDAAHELPVASARAKVAARDSLADEEALLEQARRLAGASPSQAFALLQQHQRRFPAGQLAAERMFLSVDVLTRLGNPAGARKQADALIRAFPNSVYAAQVKARSSTPD
jgi:hypothetical protein